MNRINLPIPNPATVRHHQRPLFNRFFARQSASAIIPSIPFALQFSRSPQVFPQAAATPFVLPDPTVNRLVAHHGLALKRSPPHNLFGAELLANQVFNRRKFLRSIKPVPPRAVLSATRFLHRLVGPIPPIMRRLIPLHLPIQRATMPPKMFCHLAHPKILAAQRRQFITFLRA